VTTLAYLWLAWSLCLLPFLVGWIRADHKHCVAYYVILLWKFYGHGGSSMKPITENTLFYGDNLFILREHILTESVDLIYLDPPFNSSRNYNVLFKDE